MSEVMLFQTMCPNAIYIRDVSNNKSISVKACKTWCIAVAPNKTLLDEVGMACASGAIALYDQGGDGVPLKLL